MNDIAVLPLDAEVAATLRRITTATLTTVLLKKGLRSVWMRGTRPLQPGVAPRDQPGQERHAEYGDPDGGSCSKE